MAHFKSVKSMMHSYLLPIVAAAAVLMFASGYDQSTQTDLQLCNQPFALCTSALCIPQPGDPSKSICYCDVEEGDSMSSTSCNQLKPSTDANGVQTLYSTYSLKQYVEGKKGMKCPSGTPWSNCLNKKCTVDPSNPQKAICLCDIVRTGDWMTLGGDCDTSTCQTGYWSGARNKDTVEGTAFLVKKLNMETSPLKWCPID